VLVDDRFVPVIIARELMRCGVPDDAVLQRLDELFHLDRIDAVAGIAAGRVLLNAEHRHRQANWTTN